MEAIAWPETFHFPQVKAEVDNVSFPDEDLDRGDLGGILEWSPPLDISQAKATQSDRTVCVAA